MKALRYLLNCLTITRPLIIHTHNLFLSVVEDCIVCYTWGPQTNNMKWVKDSWKRPQNLICLGHLHLTVQRNVYSKNIPDKNILAWELETRSSNWLFMLMWAHIREQVFLVNKVPLISLKISLSNKGVAPGSRQLSCWRMLLLFLWINHFTFYKALCVCSSTIGGYIK